MHRSDKVLQLSLPVDGPLPRSEYFAPRTLIPGGPLSPRLAVGTAGLGGVWGPKDLRDSIGVLHDAWGRGSLVTDTAPTYARHGSAEEVIGHALQSWTGPEPVLLTKLEGHRPWAPVDGQTWRDALEAQVQTSTRLFGGRAIAGLALHDPERAAPEFEARCAEFLRELHRTGRVRAIGLGGGGPDVQARQLATGAFHYVITYLRLTACSLQALVDVVPRCRAAGAAVVVGSAVCMGLLGSRYERYMTDPPWYAVPVFITRARRLKALADDAGLSLPHLALRFVWSMPAVDFVLAGAGRPTTWADTVAAYEAGPLPPDLYARVWQIAQEGAEPETGG